MNAWGEKFTQACRGMRAVLPCGGADRSRASLKFGVQGMSTDSCYFFSLPRVSIYSTVGDFLDPNIRVIRGPYCTNKALLNKGAPLFSKPRELALLFFMTWIQPCEWFWHSALSFAFCIIWQSYYSHITREKTFFIENICICMRIETKMICSLTLYSDLLDILPPWPYIQPCPCII